MDVAAGIPRAGHDDGDDPAMLESAATGKRMPNGLPVCAQSHTGIDTTTAAIARPKRKTP